MLASASGDQTIRVWDMQNQFPEAVATLRGHKGSVKSVQFRPNSRCELVSGARGGDIILWDTRVGQGSVTTLSVKVCPLPAPPPAPSLSWCGVSPCLPVLCVCVCLVGLPGCPCGCFFCACVEGLFLHSEVCVSVSVSVSGSAAVTTGMWCTCDAVCRGGGAKEGNKGFCRTSQRD